MDASLSQPWWRRFVRLALFTLREEDVTRVEPTELVGFARGLGAEAFGVTAAGIAAFYPSELAEHRRSPFLADRDYLGEVLQAAHRDGVKVLARVDPSLADTSLLEEHPDWFSRTATGEPIAASGLYVTCPNGPYYRMFIPDVVRELLRRYDLDGIWVNGGRFSAWEAGQCFCVNCHRSFAREAGGPIPSAEWQDPRYGRFLEWRYRALADWVGLMRRVKDELRADIPLVLANQLIEPWEFIRGGGWDLDLWADAVDILSTEGQRRNVSAWWLAAEAKYLRSLGPEMPRWVTVSYFYPWWRLYSAPVPENRTWLAQVVANGSSPWIHLNGHASEVYDRRGLDATRDFYAFLDRDREIYDGATSQAEIALIFSRRTVDHYGRERPGPRYLDHFRGYYQALSDAGLNFDVISDTLLDRLDRWRVVVAPNLACLSDEAAAALRAYVERGGGLVATFETGHYDPLGATRERPALDGLLGTYLGVRRDGLQSAYLGIIDRDHRLLMGLGDTDLLPLFGSILYVRGEADAAAPLTLIPPVRAHGGSDMSIPEHNRVDLVTRQPMALVGQAHRGRVVYFPNGIDAMYRRFGFGDLGLVLANAVRLAHGGRLDVEVGVDGYVELSLMHQPGRQLLHLINMSGGRSVNSGWRHPLQRTVGLGPVEIRLRPPREGTIRRVRTVREAAEVPFECRDGWIRFSLPRLAEYEIIAAEYD